MKITRSISSVAAASLLAVGIAAPTATAADIVDRTTNPQVAICSAKYQTFDECNAQHNRIPSSAQLRVFVRLGKSQHLADNYGYFDYSQSTPFDSAGRAVGNNYGWLSYKLSYSDDFDADGEATVLPSDWQDLSRRVGTYTFRLKGRSETKLVNGNWYKVTSPDYVGSFTVYDASKPHLSGTSGWKQSGGKWYYYLNGKKVTGWKRISGNWYYFNSKGQRYTGLHTIAGKTYHFNSKGHMATGWRTIGSRKYFFNSAGQAYKGVHTIAGKKYYFNSKGHMLTGLRTVGSKKYYFNSKGQAQRGWQRINGKRYYFRSDYAATTGWKTIGSHRYYFRSDGVLIKTL